MISRSRMELVGRLPSEHFERYHVLQGRRVFTLIAIFLLNHFAGFTKGQGLGLGEEVETAVSDGGQTAGCG